MTGIYDIEVLTIDGVRQRLDVYRGKTLLIVNVASRCGFTPQYRGLEALYRKFKSRDVVVLGFPCDQFGHQEPGTEAEIREFCTDAYNVTFPLFSKINVNGEDAHPLYRLLKSSQKGLFGSEAVKWNFTKFLVDRHGSIISRHSPREAPEAIERDLVRLIAADPSPAARP
jgi:glutathione peroxidase